MNSVKPARASLRTPSLEEEACEDEETKTDSAYMSESSPRYSHMSLIGYVPEVQTLLVSAVPANWCRLAPA